MLPHGLHFRVPLFTGKGIIPCVVIAALLTGASPCHAHGSYHSVVEKISKRLADAPDDAALRFQLALAHSEHEEWQLCLEEVDRIDALAPGKFNTGWLRGLSLHQAGRNKEAKEELDRFLQSKPGHAEALFDRARTSLALGDATSAAGDAMKALELAPRSSVEKWIFSADCLQAAGRTEEAADQLAVALKKRGKDPLLFRQALALDIDLQRWDTALERIEELRKLAPKPEPWMAERAHVLGRAGRADESRRSWQSLLDHLQRLPGLERGSALNLELAARSRSALGLPSAAPVNAPPAPLSKAASP